MDVQFLDNSGKTTNKLWLNPNEGEHRMVFNIKNGRTQGHIQIDLISSRPKNLGNIAPLEFMRHLALKPITKKILIPISNIVKKEISKIIINNNESISFENDQEEILGFSFSIEKEV